MKKNQTPPTQTLYLLTMPLFLQSGKTNLATGKRFSPDHILLILSTKDNSLLNTPTQGDLSWNHLLWGNASLVCDNDPGCVDSTSQHQSPHHQELNKLHRPLSRHVLCSHLMASHARIIFSPWSQMLLLFPWSFDPRHSHTDVAAEIRNVLEIEVNPVYQRLEFL